MIFPKQWLHERASMLRYTYIVCLVTSVYQLCQAANEVEGILRQTGTGEKCSALCDVKNPQRHNTFIGGGDGFQTEEN